MIITGQCTYGSVNQGIAVTGLNLTKAIYNASDAPTVQCNNSADYVFRTDNNACLGKSGAASLTCLGNNTWFPSNGVKCSPGCPPIAYDVATVTLASYTGCGDASNNTKVTVSCINPYYQIWKTPANNTSIRMVNFGVDSLNVTCQTSKTWTQNGFMCHGKYVEK